MAHNLQVTDEKSPAQRGKVTCPMPPSWEGAKRDSHLLL